MMGDIKYDPQREGTEKQSIDIVVKKDDADVPMSKMSTLGYSDIGKEFLIRLTSRKFLLALASLLVPLLNRKLNWNLTSDEILQIEGLFATFIVVEGVNDIRKN